jgi:ParB-like chromosome segregation protein Spo0J
VSELINADIESLKPHPDNARRGDVAAIMRSLERFGQQKPIVVQRSTGYVVAGNHTLEAAKRLGWKTIQAVVQDLDDESARQYLITDNATSDRSTYDRDKQSKLLTLEGAALNAAGIISDDEWEGIREELSGKREESGGRPTRSIEIETRDSEDDEAGTGESSGGGSSGRAPMREIPLRMPASQIEHFSAQVLDLQTLWDMRTLVDIVERAVDEAHQRWQAGVGVDRKAQSADALPPELQPQEF